MKSNTGDDENGDFYQKELDYQMVIGKRLSIARKKSGLTQSDAAKQIGKSASLISQWENGKREIGIGNLKALSKIYGVSETWVMTGIEHSNRGHRLLNAVENLPFDEIESVILFLQNLRKIM